MKVFVWLALCVAALAVVLGGTRSKPIREAAPDDFLASLSELRRLHAEATEEQFLSESSAIATRIASRTGSPAARALLIHSVERSEDAPGILGVLALAAGRADDVELERWCLGLAENAALAPEVRRGALLGVAGGSGEQKEALYGTCEYFTKRRTPPLPTFHVALARRSLPSEVRSTLQRIASADTNVLELRELAILLLGQEIDHDPFVSDFCLRHVHHVQSGGAGGSSGLLPVCTFVLEHLRDPIAWSYLADLAELLLTGDTMGPGGAIATPGFGLRLLEVLVRTAPGAAERGRVARLGIHLHEHSVLPVEEHMPLLLLLSILYQDEGTVDGESARMLEETFQSTVLAEAESVAKRSTALRGLSLHPSDRTWVLARRILLGDPTPLLRERAALVLPVVARRMEDAAEALVLAYPAETSERVRAGIRGSLAKLDAPLARAFLGEITQDAGRHASGSGSNR